MTLDDVQRIVKKYVDVWNRNAAVAPLWVSLASPGDLINIPGVMFGTAEKPTAGMEIPIGIWKK